LFCASNHLEDGERALLAAAGELGANVENVQTASDFRRRLVKRGEESVLVDLVFEMMKETLSRGEKIKISGFGNFVLRDKKERPGLNPQTKERITISERRVLTFKASQILKQALNPRESNGASATAEPPKTTG
jgi:integration host factor subunit alpha